MLEYIGRYDEIQGAFHCEIDVDDVEPRCLVMERACICDAMCQWNGIAIPADHADDVRERGTISEMCRFRPNSSLVSTWTMERIWTVEPQPVQPGSSRVSQPWSDSFAPIER